MLKGHSDDGGGIQKHSAGDLYPAVIRTVETYRPAGVLAGTRYEVLLPGRGVVATASTYALAERKARAALKIEATQAKIDALFKASGR